MPRRALTVRPLRLTCFVTSTPLTRSSVKRAPWANSRRTVTGAFERFRSA